MGFYFLSMATDSNPTDGGVDPTNDRALWEVNICFAIVNIGRMGVDLLQLVSFMGFGLTC